MWLSESTRRLLWRQYQGYITVPVARQWALDSLSMSEFSSLRWFRRSLHHLVAKLSQERHRLPKTLQAPQPHLLPIVGRVCSQVMSRHDGEWRLGLWGDALGILIGLARDADLIPVLQNCIGNVPSLGHPKRVQHRLLDDLKALSYFYGSPEAPVKLQSSPSHQILAFDLLIFLTRFYLFPDFAKRSQWIHDYFHTNLGSMKDVLLEAWKGDAYHLVGTLMRAPNSCITGDLLRDLPWNQMECSPRSLVTLLVNSRGFIPPVLGREAPLGTGICRLILESYAANPPLTAPTCVIHPEKIMKPEPVAVKVTVDDNDYSIDTACILLRAQMYFRLGVPLEATREMWSEPNDEWETAELIGMGNVLLERFCQLTGKKQPAVVLVDSNLQEEPDNSLPFIAEAA